MIPLKDIPHSNIKPGMIVADGYGLFIITSNVLFSYSYEHHRFFSKIMYLRIDVLGNISNFFLGAYYCTARLPPPFAPYKDITYLNIETANLLEEKEITKPFISGRRKCETRLQKLKAYEHKTKDTCVDMPTTSGGVILPCDILHD